MGMALTSCTVPAAGKPTFSIGDDEMELGIGIHGEPGRERVPLKMAREITEIMAEAVIADLPFISGDRVIALVNGMGGTPPRALYHLQRTRTDLPTTGVNIVRQLVGNYFAPR